ncbi:MAG: hypothetical protein JG769_1204 [Oscillospiraceae bacterium]|jgi:hypothetical protein|nr:hypothetical protein [Oscillospiraceae bacterium]
MLGLPCSTEVNCRIPKEKLYAHMASASSVRDMIKNQVELIIWRNKLAVSTMGVAAGENVKEIQVFEVVLRQHGLDKAVISAIAKAIPYKILFILTFGNEVQAWMETLGSFYHTDWLPFDGFTLQFDGLNLDAVYENLVHQIAGGRLCRTAALSEAVERDKCRQKIEREIAALEKKILHEKQFNKQVEMNRELKRLKKELEEYNNEQAKV